MSQRPTRRQFLHTTAAAGAAATFGGFWTFPSQAARRLANDKLNVAMVGTSNQAEFTIDNVQHENLAAADSRIRDVDYAAEVSELASAQILQQMAVAVLAQAQRQPALALRLLGIR